MGKNMKGPLMKTRDGLQSVSDKLWEEINQVRGKEVPFRPRVNGFLPHYWALCPLEGRDAILVNWKTREVQMFRRK